MEIVGIAIAILGAWIYSGIGLYSICRLESDGVVVGNDKDNSGGKFFVFVYLIPLALAFIGTVILLFELPP